MPYLVSDNVHAVVIHTKDECERLYSQQNLCQFQIDLNGEYIQYDKNTSHPTFEIVYGWIESEFLVAFYPSELQATASLRRGIDTSIHVNRHIAGKQVTNKRKRLAINKRQR